jgi:hypothetical protein
VIGSLGSEGVSLNLKKLGVLYHTTISMEKLKFDEKLIVELLEHMRVGSEVIQIHSFSFHFDDI